MATQLIDGRFRGETDAGLPLVGGLLYTYASGTTTPKAAYTDATLATPATNPVTLNARGEAQVWLGSGAYSLKLTDSTGVQIWTADGVVSSDDSLRSDLSGVNGVDGVGGATRWLASVAALRLSSKTGAQHAFTLGYWATGDGGGGEYRCDPTDTTSADTGLAVIVAADGGRWKLVHDGRVSVKQAGAKGDGVTDDAAAFRACIEYCVGPQYTVVVTAPSASYLIKSTLSIYNGTKIEGESTGQFVQGYGQIPKFSHIHFVPTTSGTDLFATAKYGHTDPFTEQISVSGLYCSAGAGVRYCFQITAAIYSTFRDIGIMDFVAGFNINLSINNRYENVIIKGSTVSPVIYSSMSDVATTDVWDQCTFFSAPQGPYLQGCIGIRFTNCIWEQLENYGLHMARDCRDIEVIGGYCEDVPYTNNAGGAMFRFGYDAGTGLPVDVGLKVIGGTWNGRNAGTVGSFLDCDHANGIVIQGVTHNRFTTILKTTANTRINSVVWMGSNGFGFTTFATDLSKLSGIYPNGVLNTGTNAQHMRMQAIRARNIYAMDESGSEISLDGGAVIIGAGAAAAAYPSTDNAFDFGTPSARWRSMNSGQMRLSSAATAGAGGTLTLGGTVSNTATAGGAAALPATPTGYLVAYIGGSAIKVPYYNA